VRGTVTASLYSVSFEEALTAILASNGCTWREQGNFIYVYTAAEVAEMESSSRGLLSRLFRLHYVRAADVQSMIQPLLSAEGQISVSPQAEAGISSDPESAGGDSLSIEDCVLVRDYPEHMEEIARLIAELDVRPRQVLIEATILQAVIEEDNALGIDFDLVGGVDFQNISATSNPALTNLVRGELPQAELDNTTLGAQTDFRSIVPEGGFTFGIIKNNVSLFIRALEQVTDTTVLANPKVLALNKQRGEVIVGRRDGYLTTTVTETAAVQNIEFLETGTQLVFRPFIGDDGYIRMEIHPEDSTGGLTASNLPEEQTTEVTTNIVIRDGHTILIGGLFREQSRSSRRQVPLIGNIPGAGALFRNTRDETSREEVIILLTVHLVKDDEPLLAESAKAMQDVERYRVGMREGVQWLGRERLAQAHYQWAIQHLEKGNVSQALWDLDLALNNNPKFLAAMKMREELRGKRHWDDEGSDVRGFLQRLIMEEEGLIHPMFGRPAAPPDIMPFQEPDDSGQGGDSGNANTVGSDETRTGDNDGVNSKPRTERDVFTLPTGEPDGLPAGGAS
jgi:type IV pilus assembly protein PilQ